MSARDRIGIASIRVFPAAMFACSAAFCAVTASQDRIAGTVLNAVLMVIFAALAVRMERTYRRVVAEHRTGRTGEQR